MRPCPKNPSGKPWHLRQGGNRRCGNCGDYFPTIGLSPNVVAEPNPQRRGAMLHEENVELLDLLERVLYQCDDGEKLADDLREEAQKWLRQRPW